MELKNNICKVTIKTAENKTPKSIVPKTYDIVLNPENYGPDEDCAIFTVHIKGKKIIDIALIGDCNSYDDACGVLEDHILTVVQDRYINQIDVLNGHLLLHKRYEINGCAFGLYKVPKEYVVHGEIKIVMLDDNFNKQWGFCGHDIFVSITHKKPFETSKDVIKLYDFNDFYYELDYDGNLLTKY